MDSILELKNITKLYPGVVALDSVNIEFQRGEVHAIVGENGAGKSTLIKAVSGVVKPTSGMIVVEGVQYEALTPNLSKELGIAVVYQEFSLIPVLSVAENIFLGDFMRRGWIVNQKEMEYKSAELFNKLNTGISPKSKVADLTTGYQQMVEIAKALSKNSKILIMDEPSAPLTTNEVDAMFKMVSTLKKEGVTIIYISHRLEEIFSVSDRVSVFRDGKHVKTLQTAQTNKNELVQLMVGRTLKEVYPERNAIKGETILEVKNLSGNGVKDISFNLKRGEILGLGGLVGAGRSELVEVLFGQAKMTSGEVLLNGRKLRIRHPKQAVALGISLVPEDRKKHGVILKMNIKENITLTVLKRRLSGGWIIRKNKETELAKDYMNRLKIRAPNHLQLVGNLSGGNQQKVVLGKWLVTQPQILVMDEPTRGIDIGAKQEIYKMMADMVREGYAIIMISSEMEELIGMSDRILVLSKGRMSGTLEKHEFNQESILKLSTGDIKDDEEN